MYIEKLEINGFGRFHDLELKPGRGFNLVYGENESGKSTLQWFIKAMLYGLKGGKQKDGLPPPMKRFRPWTGTAYSGAMEYRLEDGSLFRIERDFERNSVKVYDGRYNDITAAFETTGRDKSVLFAENHLGLNETCFEKTVMIRQLETRIDAEGSSELLSRLANAGSSGYEDISYKSAEKALSEALKNYVGTDRSSARPLDRIEAELSELEAEISGILERRKTSSSVSARLNETTAGRERLFERKAYLKGLRTVIELRTGLDAALARESALKDILRRLKGIEDKQASAQKQLDRYHAERGQAQEGQAKGSQAQEGQVKGSQAEGGQTGGRRAAASILPAAVFAVAAVVSGIYGFTGSTLNALKPEYFLAAALIFAAFAVASAFRAARKREVRNDTGGYTGENASKLPGEHVENEQGKLLNELLKLKEISGGILNEASGICGRKISGVYELEAALAENAAVLDALDGKLDAGLKSSVEAAQGLGDLLCPDDDRLDSFDIYKPDTLEEFICDNSPNLLKEAVDMEMESMEGELVQAELSIREFQTLLKDEPEFEGRLQKLEERKAVLEEKRESLVKTGTALRLALEVLDDAGAKIRREFGPVLDERMSQIVGKLTGGRYTDLRADDALGLKAAAPQQGGIRQAISLSGGTADQMYLALRLALADILAPEGESLPLFMDEVFSQYDDNRTGQTLEYFHGQNLHRQIICFTCKEREAEIARRIFGSCKENGMTEIRL